MAAHPRGLSISYVSFRLAFPRHMCRPLPPCSASFLRGALQTLEALPTRLEEYTEFLTMLEEMTRTSASLTAQLAATDRMKALLAEEAVKARTCDAPFPSSPPTSLSTTTCHALFSVQTQSVPSCIAC